MLLGCIADDFTGATDLANMLVRAGMRDVQTIGVPRRRRSTRRRRCGRRRAEVAHDPGRRGGARSRWRRCAGCRRSGARQFYFKYCSTFDSTPRGQHRPGRRGADGRARHASFTIACPAFPDNGRTIFNGHLFVGDVLLCDSGMRDHPLTPMTDANLVRVLQAQSRRARRARRRYHRSAQARRRSARALARAAAEGVGIAVADAIDNDDLLRSARLRASCRWSPAGSGLALGLPAELPRAPARRAGVRCRRAGGRRRRSPGSCSRRDARAGRAHSSPRRPALRVDPPRRWRRRRRRRCGSRALGRWRSAGVPLVYSHRRARAVARGAAGARARGRVGGARSSGCSPRSRRGAWSPAARAGSSSPAARPRAPWSTGARHRRPADRRRRSIPACRATRAGAGRRCAGAEVGQLRRRRLLRPRRPPARRRRRAGPSAPLQPAKGGSVRPLTPVRTANSPPGFRWPRKCAAGRRSTAVVT